MKNVGGIYTNSTGSLTFNRNTYDGYSYGWYKITGLINGERVLNTYNYSATTGKHVSKLNQEFSFDRYIEAPNGLDSKKDIIDHYWHKIHGIKKAMKNGRKSKNEERAQEIVDCKEIINFIIDSIEG